MVETIRFSSNNYQEAELLRAAQENMQVGTKTNRDVLKNPTENVSKTAQVANDIMVISGANMKALPQIVIENNTPIKDINFSAEAHRNLGVSQVESPIGTQANENALTAEVNSKNNL